MCIVYKLKHLWKQSLILSRCCMQKVLFSYLTLNVLLLLLFNVIFPSTLIENCLDFIGLDAHVFRCNATPAHWANVIVVEPAQNAISVESMAHIAAKRRHLITFFEICEADGTVANSPKTTLVVVDLWSVVHHILSGILLMVLLAIVIT